VLCARFVGTPFDFILRFLTLLGSSVPIFWLGLILLLIFYATLLPIPPWEGEHLAQGNLNLLQQE
jgi:ABC-type dipeptide/oligopeptide/nickel transport system permease component